MTGHATGSPAEPTAADSSPAGSCADDSRAPAAGAPPWSGAWVHDRLDVEITTDADASIVPVDALVGLALRRNPRRAHLLVSTVLAKHVPTAPGVAIAAGHLLGAAVADRLRSQDARGGVPETPSAALRSLAAECTDLLAGGEPEPTALAALRRGLIATRTEHPDVRVLGFAETATGLGRLVADQLGAPYLHSTRHSAPGAVDLAAFEEEHSHATSHRLLPDDPDWLTPGGTIVLVDDELSTGRTVMNTIGAIEAVCPQRLWVVASLVDVRRGIDRRGLQARARELGLEVRTVALGVGRARLPADLSRRSSHLLEGLPVREGLPSAEAGLDDDAAPATGVVEFVDLSATVPPVRSDRFGCPPGAVDAPARAVAAALNEGALSEAALSEVALSQSAADDGGPDSALEGALDGALVLGTEEFIGLPLAVADLLRASSVRFSTTTRSPIAPIDEAGYAIRTAVAFDSHDDTVDGPGRRYAYNLTASGRRFRRILVFPEPGSDPARLVGEGSLTQALAAVTDRVTVVLLAAEPAHPTPPVGALPEPLAGPAFGSYDADDVRWLLQDLGDAALEAPAAEREREIQSGRANYAESLPVEYVPSREYQELYDEALARSARRVAEAVGVVTELSLAARGGAPALVSLARAGTPVGVLMRRWARHAHGLDLPHFTMSIVRGVGIDTTALRWLAEHYDPARVVFVDGWTGKGAIARELSAALALHEAETGVRFGDDLAVLADPGHCVTTFGTRDDYLIPSACLNSTVSGLVSRTVYSTSLIGPDEFHGAKFYRDLAASDVSRDFLAAIEARFDDVRDDVARALDTRHAEPATWEGWQAVERLSRDYGIHDVNLVKPGVGETTRVLLRRVPWKILVRPDARADIAHVLLLAAQRGVEVVEVSDLPYSCVGLIHPLSSPGADALGATGAL